MAGLFYENNMFVTLLTGSRQVECKRPLTVVVYPTVSCHTHNIACYLKKDKNGWGL